MNKIEKLKTDFEKAVVEYVDMFAEKQELDFEFWVGDEVGGFAVLSDFVLNFTDIMLDIKTNQPKGNILKWFSDNQMSTKYINYNSYIMGLRVKDLENE